MAPVRSEAKWKHGLRPELKTQVLRLRHSRNAGGNMRFPVGLPNGRTPLEWALAAAATSFCWPVADNVRSISVLRRFCSRPMMRMPDRADRLLGVNYALQS